MPVQTSAPVLAAWWGGEGFVRLALALITLAGAALRFAALRDQPMVTGDGTEYVRFAEALARGHSFQSVFPPGYPLLIALARLVIPGRVAAAVAVSMLAGIALPAIVWTLARRALGERGALVPALLCALHLELARHSAVTLSEPAYIAVLYLGLAALVMMTRWPRALLGGLALGCAYAIRPEGLIAILVLAVTGVVAVARRRLAVRPALVAALTCLVVVLACIGWYHQTLGTWTLTPKSAALHAAEQDWRAVELHAGEAVGHTRPLASRLAASVRAWPANALVHAEALLWAWPWPLLALSLWGLARRRGVEGAALAYLPLLPFLGLTQQERFALPALPALAICACVPLLHERSPRLRAVAAALMLFGLVACTWALSDAFRTPFEGGRNTDRLAGEWLAHIARPGETVVDRKPFVAFYANRTRRVLPTGSRDAVLDSMVGSGARWFVLQEYVAHQMRPELAPLLDSVSVREREARIEMVYARADAGEGSLAIFRVLRPGERKSGAPPVVQTAGFAAQP